MIGHTPRYAAFLIAGATALQLPTPTPGMPEIPLSEIESIITTASNQAKELSLQQMVFVVTVLLVVFGIAVAIWLIRRPNKPKAEQTVAETAAELVVAARQDVKDARQELLEEQREWRAQNTENMTIYSDASNRLADGVSKLDASFDRLTTHIEQLASRETARDKTLETMTTALDTMVQQGSEPLRKLITMAETMLEAATEIKDSVARIECQQSELRQALETIKKTEQALTEIAEDTGKIRAIVEPLDTDKPAAA